MKVNFSGNNIYKSKLLKNGLEFAANNGALFSAGVALTLSTVARPVSIFAAPKTDKENKKLACAKSLASTTVGFGLMMGATLPVTKSIAKIDKTPKKYLKQSSINILKDSSKTLTASKGYQFATQLFKLGIGTIAAIPKALITCALIPPIMSVFFNSKNTNKRNDTDKNMLLPPSTHQNNRISFKGRVKTEPFTKGLGKILNSERTLDFVKKYKDTNYPMHIAAMTDTAATGTFILQTKNSKKIEDDRKKVLCTNAGIATGLSIVSSYITDKLTNKSTEKFIQKFREANKESPKLEKYVEGIRIAKPALIMGGIYYCVIPFVSTFIADRFDNKTRKN